MLSALFGDVTQRMVIVSYRRFRTIYRSTFKGQESLPVGLLTVEDGTDRLFRNFCKELTRNMPKRGHISYTSRRDPEIRRSHDNVGNWNLKPANLQRVITAGCA